VLPRDLLDLPLPTADPHTARLFEQQCAEILDHRQVRRGTSGVVRGILLRRPAEMASMEETAAELHLDTRTLHRRLTAEGTSFRALEAEVREGLAIELLSRAGLSVGEVARRLGYSEVAAFSRAFKRWTGHPPSERVGQ
jgi:AraC-like DNA-binding protein